MAGGLAILAGWLIGAVVALGSPVAAFVVVAGLLATWLATRSVQASLLGLVVVASLLPYAVIPLRVGVSLTFVDALLAACVLGWLLRHVSRAGQIVLTPAGRPLLGYLVTAGVALVIGAAFAPVSGAELRSVLKYLTGIFLFVIVVNVIRERGQIRQLTGALIVGGALASAIGLGIQALPRPTIVEVLSSLSVLGYPSGPEVLRFLPGPNNTYSDTLRAVGTSIDPNVFGGLLMLAGSLMLGEAVAPRPRLPRWLLLGGLAVTAAAMVASQSRSSWLGLAVAGAVLATLRERRLWLAGVAGVSGLLALPIGRTMAARLASGFAAQDRAAALRLDEYRQALEIIRQYPLLGVGFGGAPELGTFVGVSSMYLLVGEHTGLIGLGLFVLTLAILAVSGVRAAVTAPDEHDRALVATLLAAFAAALVAGNLDHYFMNPRFPHMVALFWLYAGLLAAAIRLSAARASATGVP
ncbi:MAG: O-antigen ligase family protein [Chloroflexi bacterium]|nr:O-antigen ligase family protein [Chloroflexota bacterium]